MPADRLRVDVEGRALELSNLDKVLYPAAGFTKGEVIDYYTRIAPVLLPHLRGPAADPDPLPQRGRRQVVLREEHAGRDPGLGARGERCPRPGSTKGRETIDYVVADDLPTLVWLANLAALELHTPQWKDRRTHPDMMVVDLDPGPPAGLAECCPVAVLMRDRLADDGIDVVPEDVREEGHAALLPDRRHPVRPMSSPTTPSGSPRSWSRRHPKLIVSKMAKNLRPGQGLHRLESEQRGEDHGGAVLAAGPADADGVRRR